MWMTLFWGSCKLTNQIKPNNKNKFKATVHLIKMREGQAWSCTYVIPALWRQKHEDLYEFKDSLVYIWNFRLVRAT